MLDLIYQDDSLVAINKPHGLLVHRSPIARNADRFAVQELRNQLDQHVYPIHRLDRKTSGVLLFALNEDMNRQMQLLFQNREVTKTYWAVVRGYTDEKGTIDYALTNDKGKEQEAISHYQTLEKTEIPVPFGKHSTSRYSLVEVQPETGRMHQIRKHFAHILHPIIGDRPHGCNKQNRLFKEKWAMTTMLLHACVLNFKHPETHKDIVIQAALQPEFKAILPQLGFSSPSFG